MMLVETSASETLKSVTISLGSDANGNITDYLQFQVSNFTFQVSVVAHYEYSPFGHVTFQSGEMAGEFAFRYSTKYADTETGLTYFNYRYYDAEQGRFISHDPIEESGGVMLYGYCGNEPIGRWDYLGKEEKKFGIYTYDKNNNNKLIEVKSVDDIAIYYQDIYKGEDLEGGIFDVTADIITEEKLHIGWKLGFRCSEIKLVWLIAVSKYLEKDAVIPAGTKIGYDEHNANDGKMMLDSFLHRIEGEAPKGLIVAHEKGHAAGYLSKKADIEKEAMRLMDVVGQQGSFAAQLRQFIRKNASLLNASDEGANTATLKWFSDDAKWTPLEPKVKIQYNGRVDYEPKYEWVRGL